MKYYILTKTPEHTDSSKHDGVENVSAKEREGR